MGDRAARRQFLGQLAAGLLCLPSGVATRAQSNDRCREHFAGRTVRWIVPSSPGGGYDIYSRLLEPFVESQLGARLTIDNRTGAGGLIGARQLMEAAPDGYTLGILNGPGLLTTSLAGVEAAPNPATDFTILGRVVRSRQVWATGRNSEIRSMGDVIRRSESGPLVFGVREAGGTAFVNIAVTSHLLDLPFEMVTSFAGNREAGLAAIRGDVDLVAYSYESLRDRVMAGALRPILQISDRPISGDAALEDVPVLGGVTGVAARRAAQVGKSVSEAAREAERIGTLIGAGRLIAAPSGLSADLVQCITRAIARIMNDQAFHDSARAANRSLDLAEASEALADIRAATEDAQHFASIVAAAIQRVRR